MPWPARVAASPGEPRPDAICRCTESIARIAPGGTSGIASRTAHGVSDSACSGSSRVSPHNWSANGAPGTTSDRRAGLPGGALCCSSQSAACVQYDGIDR